ncbi:unnamed protein product [Arctia plantaginis]|uniref:RdRp catalytic domain-containing protein n=1 Tax=Arctia plantaginis TaxID=874455 RepID=A0A8S1A443_ARCPL|nr:unnamed protein product [Arctia plantaginis]
MEEEDPTPTYSSTKRKPVFRRDRHLQSALHNGEITYMFENWQNTSGLKKEHILLKRDTKGVCYLPSDQFIHWALLHVSKKPEDMRLARELSKHIKVANDATNLGCTDFCGVSVPSLPSSGPELLRQVYVMKVTLGRITEKITFSEQHVKSYNFFGCKAKCYGNLHVIWPSDQFAYIITHRHFLAVRDCINAWFSALAYSYACCRKSAGYNLYTEVANVIYSVLHDISMYKDKAYDILKCWQPLVIATILKDIEGDPHFYNSLKDIIIQYPHSLLLKIATRKISNTIDVHLAFELTGLTKCFGHPEVVMGASIATWVEKGTVLKPGLGVIAEEIRRAFVLEFSRNFYKQKRKWPNLKLGPNADPLVKQCCEGGYWGEDPGEPWSTAMFSDIQFDETMEFDYQIYTADLLADKSIIPSLEHWPYEYDGQAHRTNHGFFPTVPPRESNNVIMQYIGREEVNVKNIIQTVSEKKIPKSWKVTVGVAKEREMKKTKARFFGKLTLEMRLFQVATENNIKNVFKFIPHQTMTKSEDDLFKHLLRISESSSQDEGGHVFMAMDFSSWCTSFRFEGVTPLFEELDRLLGVTDVMAYTQIFPLESTLLFQDRFHPPKQGPDGYPLNGPRATLEGMRMTRHSYIKWFQETLLDLCTQAGITLKLEETWVSSSLLECGREFFFKGAQVSSSLKRISRISSEANQTIPSFNSDIAGIYSTGMSSAQKDHTPIPSFWATVLEASIAAHERFPELSRYPPEYISCLLSVPRTLGGWPITLFANFATRSIQDPLTTALHLVRTFLSSPRHRQHMVRIASTRMKTTDPTMLIKDPQSLPLVLPRQPENYLKSKIAEGLPSIIKNKELTPLFSPQMEENKQRLIGDLMTIRPCNPKLMSKLMTLSNVGKQEALVNKFSSTRSIQNVACRE